MAPGPRGTDDVTIHEYPDLDHLLRAGSGPSQPAEYAIAGHVAAEVVADLAAWVRSVQRPDLNVSPTPSRGRPDDAAPSRLDDVGLDPDDGVQQVTQLGPPGPDALDDQDPARRGDLDGALARPLIPRRRPVADRQLAATDRLQDALAHEFGPVEEAVPPGHVVGVHDGGRPG